MDEQQSGQSQTRCPDPCCGLVFSLNAGQIGEGARCPACGRELTARPLAIWRILEQRETAFLSKDRRSETLERLENPASLTGPRQRRLLYHQPPATDSDTDTDNTDTDTDRHERRHDVQYEPSVDHPSPCHEPIPQLVAVLDDLRSQWNVGSIFRTADGAGWGGLHLCGITPMPPARGLLRVSLGAEEFVPWDYRARVLETLAARTEAGFTPVALEQTDDACDLYAFVPPQRMALVVGNEVAGVSREALQVCPLRVCIPVSGRKASLNAAVAFGVAALELRRRWLALHG